MAVQEHLTGEPPTFDGPATGLPGHGPAGVLGLAGTMTVADSLQIIYEEIHGLSHRGLRDSLRFLVWVAVFFGAMVAEGFISPGVTNPVAQAVVAFAGISLFFWWTMHFLLGGRVGWRVLVAPAVVTALFWLGWPSSPTSTSRRRSCPTPASTAPSPSSSP